MSGGIQNTINDFAERTKERIENINGYMLVAFALFLFFIAGVFMNLGTSYGFTTHNATYSGYPCYTNDPLGNTSCNIYNPSESDTGFHNPNINATCPQTPKYCSLNQTISILNNFSPFTDLSRGNIIGFFNSWFVTANQSAINQLGTGIVNGSTFYDCTNSSETYYTCLDQTPANVFHLNVSLSFISKIISNCGTDKICQNESGLLIQDSGNSFSTYPNYVMSASINDAGTGPQFFVNQIASAADVNVSTNSNMLGLLALLGGLVLTLMAVGFYISGQIIGTGASAGVNPQGTKFAQVFGIGLLAYSFFYSEFGYAITTLNNLMGGVGSTFLILLSIMYFFGLYQVL
jgi:hypothetical protein